MEKDKLIKPLFLLFVFFLPFHYALTFKLGFNIKVSEVCMCLLIILLHKEIFTHFKKLVIQEKIFALFVIWTTISFFVNYFYQYDYTLGTVPHRFGKEFDAVSKLLYLYFIFLGFIIFHILVPKFGKKSITFFEFGIYTACAYTWYLAIVSIQEKTPFLLPGMDDFPQHSLLSIGHFIRCGTFKEGNHMGLLLLISFFVGIQYKRWLLVVISLLTLLPTVSTMALLCVAIFIIIKALIYISNHGYKWLLIPSIIITFCLFYSLRNNQDVKLLVIQKIFPEKENTDYSKDWGAFSKAQRLNYMRVATKIFSDNPFFGVGIANYGLHFDHYNQFPETKYQKIKPYKPITNNVYFEILAEQGIIGLILFCCLFVVVYKNSIHYPLNFGLLSVLIYFIAYPSYTLFFVFWFVVINNQSLENSID